jgi:hypothetical protein
MQPQPQSTVNSTGRIGIMAFAFAVALTILVVGCAVDDSWWSLATAFCYLLALGCWAMFRPGCMPCVPVLQPGMAANNGGLCGGTLGIQWGAHPPTHISPSATVGPYRRPLQHGRATH